MTRGRNERSGADTVGVLLSFERILITAFLRGLRTFTALRTGLRLLADFLLGLTLLFCVGVRTLRTSAIGVFGAASLGLG